MTQLDLFDRSLVAAEARRRADLTQGLNDRIGGSPISFNKPSPSASRKAIIIKYKATKANTAVYQVGPFTNLGALLDRTWRRALAWTLDVVYRHLMGLC